MVSLRKRTPDWLGISLSSSWRFLFKHYISFLSYFFWMLLQINHLIYEVFHLKKVFPLPVCILCGCFLLRPTQWLNQYKVPSRQWKTTRKCSIIKLNYRQALKETNTCFVTIKPCFFIAMMIENGYERAWHSGGRGEGWVKHSCWMAANS